MCALAVPVEQPILEQAVCVNKRDLASRLLSNASNTRFTHAQIDACSNVDWITIYQDHHDKRGTLRKIDGGMILNLEDLSESESLDSYIENSNPIKIVPVKRKDEEIEDDELEEDEAIYKQLWVSHKKFLAEGSHNTRLMLFCDGTRVFLSGNVGRWGRSDNLFNLRHNDIIKKCNSILAKYDLPPFTNGQVDYLQARSMSYVSKSVSGRSSVQWGKKGGRLYTKAYVKFQEMLDHSKKKDHEALVNSFAYKFAKEKGIVRIETEIDRKTLAELNLRDLERIDMKLLSSIAKSKIDHLLDDVPVGLEHFEPEIVFHKKEHKKYIKTLAMWKSGMDLKAYTVMSKATFYRHQKEILKISGIDIEQRYVEGVTVDALSLVSKIKLEPLERPEQYSLGIDWNAPELKVIDLTKHLPTRKEINHAILGVSGTVPTQEFLDTDLAEPNHALIEKNRAQAKESYRMQKLYQQKKQNKPEGGSFINTFKRTH